jgi:hypothetical protein
MDSLLFAAPVVFHITGYYFGTHLAMALKQPEWLRTVMRLWL